MTGQSTYDSIMKRIEELGRGDYSLPEAFADAGTYETVRSALVLLCESGILTHVAHGIYCSAQIEEIWGSASILPYVGEIAQANAVRDRIRITPTGDYTLHRKGLSTQILANVVFVIDCPLHHVAIGKWHSILFKHTSEMRTFTYQSSLMALIVTVLRKITEENNNESQLTIIQDHLRDIPAQEFTLNHPLPSVGS